MTTELKLEFEGTIYYSVDAFVRNADLSRYRVEAKDGSGEMNTYEFFWKFFQKELQQLNENEDEGNDHGDHE